MTWVKLDDNFAEHPKIANLTARAFRLHVSGLCYCARFLTDGHITRAQALALDQRAQGSADAAGRQHGHSNGVSNGSATLTALVSAGLWEPTGEGFAIHDYLRYNPSRNQVLSEREAGRKRAAASAEARAQLRVKQRPASGDPSRPVPNYKDSTLARTSPEATDPSHIGETLVGKRLRLQPVTTASPEASPEAGRLNVAKLRKLADSNSKPTEPTPEQPAVEPSPQSGALPW